MDVKPINETRTVLSRLEGTALHVQSMCTTWGLPELSQRLGELATSFEDQASRIVVVGGFKSGKSSVLNSIAGSSVVPVHPIHPSTLSIEVIPRPEVNYGLYAVPGNPNGKDGEATEAALYRVGRDEVVAATWGQLTDIEGARITGVLITHPLPGIAGAATLIDTPPISGGLSSSASLAVMEQLHRATAMVYVAEAAQELTAPEAEFLEAAAGICSGIRIVLTKIDQYPYWRDVLAANVKHLRSIGIPQEPFPVSAQRFQRGLSRGHERACLESNIAQFGQRLEEFAVGSVVGKRAFRLGTEVDSAGRALLGAINNELIALDHSAPVDQQRQTVHDLHVVAMQLDPSNPDVAKRLKDLGGRLRREFSQHLKFSFQDLEAKVQTVIEAGDPGKDWAEMQAEIQHATTVMLIEHVRHLRKRSTAEVEGLFREIGLDGETVEVGDLTMSPNLHQLEIDQVRFAGKNQSAQGGMTALRVGASTGAATYGVVAGAGLLLGPMAIGLAAAAAVLSGGVYGIPARKSGIERRQRQAREAALTYLRQAGIVVEGVAAEAQEVAIEQVQGEIARVGASRRDALGAARQTLQRLEASVHEQKPARISECETAAHEVRLARQLAKEAIDWSRS